MTAFERMVSVWEREKCGEPHPDNDVLGWACDRPKGHDGPHAVQTWEEWGEDE